eukprot:3573657-Prymnesium_polylepis.2
MRHASRRPSARSWEIPTTTTTTTRAMRRRRRARRAAGRPTVRARAADAKLRPPQRTGGRCWGGRLLIACGGAPV